MTDAALIERLAAELTARSGNVAEDMSAEALEAWLIDNLPDMSPAARIQTLSALMDTMTPQECRASTSYTADEDDVLVQVSSLLLGRRISADDLSSTELLEKLAESLNTIFNSLNQLISVINMSFTGEGSPEETIRQVIGFRLDGEGQGRSLEDYLGQINNAFLTSQQSFKEAAYAKVKQVLSVLDPEQLANDVGKGLKFGPLRKAEMFEIYSERYQKIQKWFSSGRFMEEFLREFEKNCQTHFKNK